MDIDENKREETINEQKIEEKKEENLSKKQSEVEK